MIEKIIDHCQEKYKFFGTGFMNDFYLYAVIVLRAMKYGGY